MAARVNAGPERGDGPRRTRSERGTAVVEFSLILPLAMMLILGLFTAAVAYNQKLSLTHAAREGARYGAAIDLNTKWSSGTWASNVRSVVVERSGGELTADQICVAAVDGKTGNAIGGGWTTQADGTSGCFADGSGDQGKFIQVSVAKPGKINALIFVVNMTLTSKGQAHYEVTS